MHAFGRQLEHPPRVVGMQEVPRGPEHVGAQDLAGVERGGHGRGIRSSLMRHPRREPPLRRQELLRLHRDEAPHDLGRRRVDGRAQPLHAEPELPQRREVHRYCTSLRQVVAPPMSVATTPMASSTRPPCHHSSDSAAPTEAML